MFGMDQIFGGGGGGAAASSGGGSYDWVGPMVGNMAGSMLQNDMNRTNADHAMDRSSEEADKQMNFQRQMSNTAYQRSVADMKAAGLNPILAGMNQAGASTPSGASGSGIKADSASNVLGNGIATAADMVRLKKELSQADAGIALDNASATKALADANASSYSAKYTDKQTKAIESQLAAIAAKAEADRRKAGYDAQAAGFDAVSSRANTLSGTAKNVIDIFKPAGGVRINPNKQFYGNKSTGEILNP